MQPLSLLIRRWLVVVGACLALATAMVVLWWHPWARLQVVDARRSSFQLSAGAITNDGQALLATVLLINTSGSPISGMGVRLLPSSPFVPAAQGVTDAHGRVFLALSVAASRRHRPESVGEVTVHALAGNSVLLAAAPRVRIYNRVAVVLQGLGTSLDCGAPFCLPSMFSPLSAAVLRPLGYFSAGSTASVVQFSYRGGQMQRGVHSWTWQPANYGACDTIESVASSAQVLREMLLAYRARYPFTTFELIGHSLGGLVALEGAADQVFLDRIGTDAVDKVITIDSPINGITAFDARAWTVDAFAGIAQLTGCFSQGMGLPLVAEISGLGDATPQRQQRWSAVLRAHGAEILTVTNQQDMPIPAQYALIGFGTATAPADRLEYAVGPVHNLGHGDLLYPLLDGTTANPVWVDLTARLRSYLRQPCLAFAASAGSCRYPALNKTS